MKAVNDTKLNVLVQKLKAFIANKYATKKEAEIQREFDESDITTSEYTTEEYRAKLYLVVVSYKPDSVTHNATVVVDWGMSTRNTPTTLVVPLHGSYNAYVSVLRVDDGQVKFSLYWDSGLSIANGVPKISRVIGYY